MASKQRILIVDDDENIAELISLYLTKECYETKIVYDGECALSEIPVFKPNLILLDLMLPGMDGYQVCREVRKNNNVPWDLSLVQMTILSSLSKLRRWLPV